MSESKPWCKSGMVYNWGGTDGFEQVLRCPGISAADIGGRMVGHDIGLSKGVLPI